MPISFVLRMFAFVLFIVASWRSEDPLWRVLVSLGAAAFTLASFV